MPLVRADLNHFSILNEQFRCQFGSKNSRTCLFCNKSHSRKDGTFICGDAKLDGEDGIRAISESFGSGGGGSDSY